MKWHKTSIDPDVVRAIAARYDLDLLSASIFVRRGITDGEAIKFYLERDLRFLHNPFLLDEMEDAVDRLLLAQAEGERVHVHGDRDVDGVTSTTVMVESIRSLGLEVSWTVPAGDEPYGLTTAIVDGCAANDVTLIVAVDCGTSNVDEIAYAQSLGIDTIVVDHHNPQPERPPAVSIVNPKLPDTTYPFEGLCACALAAKLRWALDFAQTDFYKQPICLINVRPGNGSVILEAVKIENLIELDRLTENLVPGVVTLEQTRLGDFLQGIQILVYEAAPAERLLREAFGDDAMIGLIDVAPEIQRAFPSLAGKSLVRLRNESRIGRYRDGTDEATLAAETPPETGETTVGATLASEIDVFASLFLTFAHRREEAIAEHYAQALDLVAIGSLADMMPMRDENRISVAFGLQRLSSRPRSALRLLLERTKLLGKQIEARDVGWTISPLLNAAGRMGEAPKAVELLLTDDEARRALLLEQIIALNDQRKRIGEEAWQLVGGSARESLDHHEGRFVFVQSEAIHRGVTGILAGRLARHFKAPAAVVSVAERTAVGSVRSARGMVATDLLARLEDVFIDWGGHDAAAGFQIERERLPEFQQRLREAVGTMQIDEAREEPLTIDAELPEQYFTANLKDVIARFAPFGQENPPLAFLARGVVIEQIDFMGKTQEHLRLLVSAGSNRWPAVFWSAAERVNRDFGPNEKLDIVFAYGTNFYNGTERPRLTILDIKRPGSDSAL